MIFDVAVIGAGLAGLTCAQELRQAGYSVVVIEKSRGVGGRVATRRLEGTVADHGVRYLHAQGPHSQQLITNLCAMAHKTLQLWTDRVYEWDQNGLSAVPQSCYIAPGGMNGVGKSLAEGLEIWLNRRVENLTPLAKNWLLRLEAMNNVETTTPLELNAKVVVMAIPAPQASILLNTIAGISGEFLAQVDGVKYDPCITVMAGYPSHYQQDLEQLNPSWSAIGFPQHPDLGWVGIDSSKRENPKQPVFVVQSSAKFAEKYLETTELQPVGEELLNSAAQILLPWLKSPQWLQIHRWRYAFCRNFLSVPSLITINPLPLICAGDWCGGDNIEGASRSGKSAVNQVKEILSI
jgi:renalase